MKATMPSAVSTPIKAMTTAMMKTSCVGADRFTIDSWLSKTGAASALSHPKMKGK